jgi:hypothetical protein
MIAVAALLADGTFVPYDEWVDRFPSSHAGVQILYTLTERERHQLVDGMAPAAPHVLEVHDGGGWSVHHPGASGCPGECPVSDVVDHDLLHRNTPPRPPGRYLVNLRDNGSPEYGAEPL